MPARSRNHRLVALASPGRERASTTSASIGCTARQPLDDRERPLRAPTTRGHGRWTPPVRTQSPTWRGTQTSRRSVVQAASPAGSFWGLRGARSRSSKAARVAADRGRRGARAPLCQARQARRGGGPARAGHHRLPPRSMAAGDADGSGPRSHDLARRKPKPRLAPRLFASSAEPFASAASTRHGSSRRSPSPRRSRAAAAGGLATDGAMSRGSRRGSPRAATCYWQAKDDRRDEAEPRRGRVSSPARPSRAGSLSVIGLPRAVAPGRVELAREERPVGVHELRG